MPIYRCKNRDACTQAANLDRIELQRGAAAICPTCQEPLEELPSQRSDTSFRDRASGPTSTTAALALLGITAVAGIGILLWFLLREDVTTQPPPASRTEMLLRFHGSNTLGGRLMPALASAFLEQQGYDNVHAEKGAIEDEGYIVGQRGNESVRIEIFAHGSDTAFKDLDAGTCDIGMSSRPIQPDEQARLLPKLGDLTSYAGEHVLALDGVAIIAHPLNTAPSLSIEQLANIFSGIITDWSQVGGTGGTISVYARDDKSGTYDFFNEAVLKKYRRQLQAKQRFEDSQALSEAVARDPAGIGFIGLNYVGSNKVVGIYDSGAAARKPSLLTIKTEDYLLSRRLYLYTSVAPTNPYVTRFIEFALGPSAQPVVTNVGLVNTDVKPIDMEVVDRGDPRYESEDWQRLTKGATPVPTHIRFFPNSSDLDTLAHRSIRKIVRLVSEPEYRNKSLVLIGFADATGTANTNLTVSQDRVARIKEELSIEGLPIAEAIGLGAKAFVAPNDTEEGKQRNRRVEIWLR